MNPDTPLTHFAPLEISSVGVVGAGRLGSTMARALRAAGYAVDGPVGRGVVPAGQLILLCVPDEAIPAAAAVVAGAAPLVGHTSGATALGALEAAAGCGADVFSLHPLGTFAGALDDLSDLPCAVAASSPSAATTVGALALRLGMRPFALEEEARPVYHAAASMASNFVVSLLGAAEDVLAEAGLEPGSERALLAPLVRQSVDNWVALGAPRALTGPVARGDEQTVGRQRAAVAGGRAELLPLFEVLVDRARRLSAQGEARVGAGAGERADTPGDASLRAGAAVRAAAAGHRTAS